MNSILHHPLLQRHRLWQHRHFFWSTIIAFVFLIASLGINYAAGTYASSHTSNAVSDIILDHIPALPVEDIFVQGFYIFIFLIVIALATFPAATPFTIKSIALFVIIRSFFISLTHIAPSVSQAIVDPSFIFDKFNFTGDLFFSGHTGLPFLLALVFWDHPWWRRVFVIVSIIFGVTVLLGHFHYSIDVFGAFFITYTIFHIATRVFPRDYMYLRMTPIAWMRRTLIYKNSVI